jgi:hypothetical protein
MQQLVTAPVCVSLWQGRRDGEERERDRESTLDDAFGLSGCIFTTSPGYGGARHQEEAPQLHRSRLRYRRVVTLKTNRATGPERNEQGQKQETPIHSQSTKQPISPPPHYLWQYIHIFVHNLVPYLLGTYTAMPHKQDTKVAATSNG